MVYGHVHIVAGNCPSNEMAQSFIDRYYSETTWHGKVIVMEIYHYAQLHHDTHWTVIKTAQYFQCSIGLVSENLKLANAIHSNEKILKCETRKDALRKVWK